MIEIIYKDDSNENDTDAVIKLPKNIRQIGEGGADNQIYIEDNIMNYLKKTPTNEKDIRYGVLIGSIKKGYGYTYIFINAAVDVEDIVENTIIFSDEIWTAINDNIRRYFSNLKVVGWFSSNEYTSYNDMPYNNRIHLDNFAGTHMVYLRIDRTENDENFYIYGSGGLKKQPGYHIYYEKNYNMEDYIYGSNVAKGFKPAELPKQTPKYGIEENANKSKVINGKNIFRTISKNVASIAMALLLIGTVALVSNEDAMDKVRSRINQMIDNGGENGGSKIPVVGIVNETEEPSVESTKESAEEQVVNQTTESDTEQTIEQTVAQTTEQTTEQTVAPTTEQITEQVTEEPSASVATEPVNHYILKHGDTLTSIAEKLYKDPSVVKDIMKLNNISNGDYIKEGDKLIVP